MNRNVFLRMQQSSNAPKTTVDTNVSTKVKENGLIDFAPSNPNSSKYNPDVMVEYEKLKNEKVNYALTKEMWKGITGENMDFNPEISSNFVCAKDVKDFEGIKRETENELELREKERLENEEQMRIINEQALQAVMKLEDEICGDEVNDNVVVFNDLKLNSCLQKELTEEQNDYNALLSEISKL